MTQLTIPGDLCLVCSLDETNGLAYEVWGANLATVKIRGHYLCYGKIELNPRWMELSAPFAWTPCSGFVDKVMNLYRRELAQAVKATLSKKQAEVTALEKVAHALNVAIGESLDPVAIPEGVTVEGRYAGGKLATVKVTDIDKGFHLLLDIDMSQDGLREWAARACRNAIGETRKLEQVANALWYAATYSQRSAETLGHFLIDAYEKRHLFQPVVLTRTAPAAEPPVVVNASDWDGWHL